jgi:DNA-binding CsgD family transcriptional regulator
VSNFHGAFPLNGLWPFDSGTGIVEQGVRSTPHGRVRASTGQLSGPGHGGDRADGSRRVIGGVRVARPVAVLLIIADDLTGAALEQRLREPGTSPVIWARSVRWAACWIHERGPGDLAVVSVDLEGHPDVIRALRTGGWDRVLAVSRTREVGPILTAVAAGATGVLCWPPTPPAPAADPAGVRTLSDRDRQVVGHVAVGHSDRDIAHLLSLSPLVVKDHLARIHHILGARNRAHLVAIALRAGTLTFPRPAPDFTAPNPGLCATRNAGCHGSRQQ